MNYNFLLASLRELNKVEKNDIVHNETMKSGNFGRVNNIFILYETTGMRYQYLESTIQMKVEVTKG